MSKIKQVFAWLVITAIMVFVAGIDTWTYLATGIMP